MLRLCSLKLRFDKLIFLFYNWETQSVVCINIQQLQLVFTSENFYVIMCLTRILKSWRTAKNGLDEVFNMHWFDCTRMYMRTFSRKIMITLWGHWFGRRQNGIKFCKKAKSIIVVHIWLNSLKKEKKKHLFNIIVVGESYSDWSLKDAKTWSIKKV